MPDVGHVPPGRAGRRWLRDRLATARRAGDLLDRKLRILRDEQSRTRQLADRTGEVWASRSRAADVWGVRAALLCGQRELDMSTVDGQARVDLTWNTLMGMRYPTAADCHLPDPDTAGHSPGSTALVQARFAYRAALEAAVAHAVAAEACRVLEAEVAQTRRTLRGIVSSRIPRLENALREVSSRVEESERADLIRLRWAASRGDAR